MLGGNQRLDAGDTEPRDVALTAVAARQCEIKLHPLVYDHVLTVPQWIWSRSCAILKAKHVSSGACARQPLNED